MSVKVRNIDSPFYISKDNKLELEHFCLQYNEWNKELSKISFYQRPGNNHYDKNVGDPTLKIVEKRERLLKKKELVDRCIKEACDEELSDYIFESVTKKKSYDALSAYSYIPCSRRTFYDIRARFFYILSTYR